MIFQACETITRKQVQAEIWLNNGMSPEICANEAEANRYGFYRRLNNGKLEFLPFCKPESRNYIAIKATKFNSLLDKYLPEEKK